MRMIFRILSGIFIAGVGCFCYKHDPIAAVIFYGWIIGAMNERLTTELEDLKKGEIE